jgi:hypothetical protein
MTRSAAKRATIRRMTDPNERDQVEEQLTLEEQRDEDRAEALHEYATIHESYSEMAEAQYDEEGY